MSHSESHEPSIDALLSSVQVMDKDSTKKCDREGQQGMGTRGTEVWGGRPQGSASSMHSSSCTAWDHSRTSHHCPLIPKWERERHTTTQAAKLAKLLASPSPCPGQPSPFLLLPLPASAPGHGAVHPSTVTPVHAAPPAACKQGELFVLTSPRRSTPTCADTALRK